MSVRPVRLSNSEMEEWRRCRRKWWLHTYRRLHPVQPLAPGAALRIGNLVHDALAAYYDPVVRADPVLHFESASNAEIQAQPEMEHELRAERELVVAMLAGYMEWLEETGADSELRVLGSESIVEVRIAEGVTLLSKLDAPVERASDGARLDLEHKTTGSLDAPLEIAKLNTQFLTEHLARFLSLREEGASNEEAYDRCHGVLVNMLRKVKRTPRAKPPFYGRQDVTHNFHELRSHWKHVIALARQVQMAIAHLDAGASHHNVCPPNPTPDCRWDCPFFQVCVMADDGSDFEGALSALYEQHDPLQRYADVLASALQRYADVLESASEGGVLH